MHLCGNMQTERHKRQKGLRLSLLSVSMLCFLVGTLIYLLFRSTDMYMFVPLKASGTLGYIIALRESLPAINLPEWIIYSLPDGLWLLAYVLLIEVIWWAEDSPWKTAFQYSLPMMAIIAEFAQMSNLFPGTGDPMDITAYFIALIIFTILKNKLL